MHEQLCNLLRTLTCLFCSLSTSFCSRFNSLYLSLCLYCLSPFSSSFCPSPSLSLSFQLPPPLSEYSVNPAFCSQLTLIFVSIFLFYIVFLSFLSFSSFLLFLFLFLLLLFLLFLPDINFLKGQIAGFRASGFSVSLSIDFHKPPAWVLALPPAYYMDQYPL